jgi:methionyl-tRNA formyltransferase
MEQKMDAGPVLAQARIAIEEAEWPPKGLLLSQMLFTEGANLLAEVLPLWIKGQLTAEPQDEQQATYTKKFSDVDALIDPQGGRKDFLKIRAFDKSPRAYFINPKGKRVLVTEAEWAEGKIKLLRVLPEGKKEMPYADYLRGLGK